MKVKKTSFFDRVHAAKSGGAVGFSLCGRPRESKPSALGSRRCTHGAFEILSEGGFASHAAAKPKENTSNPGAAGAFRRGKKPLYKCLSLNDHELAHQHCENPHE
jgi:hypothetical protein